MNRFDFQSFDADIQSFFDHCELEADYVPANVEAAIRYKESHDYED